MSSLALRYCRTMALSFYSLSSMSGNEYIASVESLLVQVIAIRACVSDLAKYAASLVSAFQHNGVPLRVGMLQSSVITIFGRLTCKSTALIKSNQCRDPALIVPVNICA